MRAHQPHLLCVLLLSLIATGCALLDGPKASSPRVIVTYGYTSPAFLTPSATLATAGDASAWAASSQHRAAQAVGARSAQVVVAVAPQAAHAPARMGAGLDAADEAAGEVMGTGGSPYRVTRLSQDVALPYPLDNIISTHGECRGVKKIHRGLDIGGVGPNAGLGTPIRSMTRGRVVALGGPHTDTHRHGKFDLREVPAKRRGLELPRWAEVPGYGTVRFFTRSRGWSKMGVFIEVVTEAPGSPLDGYRIRYMHMAALHPSLKEGDVVESGQELGLLGGTAVQSSLPHLHIDMDTPTGRRVDIAPFLGLPRDRRGPKRCKGRGEH
jgi:murein DD-endopeptidase MepM/ murein hydrolase activator NlpD